MHEEGEQVNRRQFFALWAAAIFGRKLLPKPAAVAPETGIMIRFMRSFDAGTRIDVLYGWDAIAYKENMAVRIVG